MRRPTHVVNRAAAPIALDGKLDEPVWQTAPDMGPLHFTWWKQGKKKRTVVKMLWDDTNLYIGHICEDEHITARYTKHDDPVPKDDCFEVMIAPDPQRPNFYFNIEWNLLGAYVDGHRAHGPKKPGVKWDAAGIRIAGTYEGTLNEDSDADRSWTCEVAIPFENWLLARICGSISWRGSITLDIVGLYIPGGVSSFEVEKPSTGASSLFRSYFDRFALKDGTREEAPVLRCCMSDVNLPTNSGEEPTNSDRGVLTSPVFVLKIGSALVGRSFNRDQLHLVR